jgi:ribosomal peptide maturation radical SAM protein 1
VRSSDRYARHDMGRTQDAGDGDSTLSLKLVNMPFAHWNRPSFALSQLSALVQRELSGRVHVQICHLNHNFVPYFGPQLYEEIANEPDRLNTGIGDWIFRQIAYPDLEDNSEKYFRRYYVGPQWMEFRERILGIRSKLERLCADMIDRYGLARADIVGFTSMFAQNVPSLALARLIKEQNPSATIVIGGANSETPMGAVLVQNSQFIDFAFSGPSLESFIDFLRCNLQGNEHGLHSIRGVVSKNNCRDIRFRSSIGRDHDINDFVEPDYKSFVAAYEEEKESIARSGGIGIEDISNPVLYFETSRGCWWGERSHCTFCGLNGGTMSFRTMSPDVALRQFQSLFQYAPWSLDYECTDNIMPKNYPKELFPLLDPPPESSIFYEVKVPISERDMRTLVRARVNKVQPGIEALSTATLKLMGKGTTAFQNIQFLKSCVRLDIEPEWNLLIGFPGEDANTYRKYQQDIPLMSHLPPPSVATLVRFDRYGVYFSRASEYDLDLKPMDFYSLIYPFGKDDLADLAYFFQDHKISPYQVNAAVWLDRLSDCVEQWREEWNNDAGRRPRLVLQRGADGGHVIYDSRRRVSETYGVDGETAAMLQRLSSPIRRDRMASEFGFTSEVASERLSFLRANELLFEEDDRIMSLVIAEADHNVPLSLVRAS